MAYENQKKKNQAMVQAYGTGLAPRTQSMVTGNRSLTPGNRSLTQNPNGKPRNNFLPPSPGGLSQDALDTMAIQNNMMMPSRGFKRAGGDKPDFLGGGMDEFYGNNPQIARGPERAQQIAQERQGQLNQGFDMGRQAVQEKLAEQQMQQQMLKDNAGQNRSIDRGYGTGSVQFLPQGQKARGTMKDPLTGNSVYMDEYLPQQSQVQDTKYGAMEGQANGGSLARPRVQQQPPQAQPQTSQNFLPQISPSGGGASDLVGAGVTQGAPGGDFSMPSWVQDALIQPALPQTQGEMYGPPDLRPQGPSSSFLPQGGDLMGPNRPNEFGPALPSFSSEQQQALEKLRNSSNFSARVGNFFPGDDYNYLQQLFPQVKPAQYPTTNALLDAYRNLLR